MKSHHSVGTIVLSIGIIFLVALYAMTFLLYNGNKNPATLYFFISAYLLVYIGAILVFPPHRYRIARKYLHDSRAYVYGIVAFFIASTTLGFLLSPSLSFLDKFLRELIGMTEGLDAGQLISFIFLNNLESSLAGLFFGIFFGIIPLFTTALNGGVVGYVLARSWAVSGVSDFWRLLPHGIFELPAVFISLGLGVKLGWTIFSRRSTFIERLYFSLIVFIIVVMPLLAIAAIIEGILIAFS